MNLIDSYCEVCNQKGYVVPEGAFIKHFVKTSQTFDLYCLEQIEKGTNIIHNSNGCTICNPKMKEPGFFDKLLRRS